VVWVIAVLDGEACLVCDVEEDGCWENAEDGFSAGIFCYLEDGMYEVVHLWPFREFYLSPKDALLDIMKLVSHEVDFIYLFLGRSVSAEPQGGFG